jgi:hypothetical protein
MLSGSPELPGHWRWQLEGPPWGGRRALPRAVSRAARRAESRAARQAARHQRAVPALTSAADAAPLRPPPGPAGHNNTLSEAVTYGTDTALWTAEYNPLDHKEPTEAEPDQDTL